MNPTASSTAIPISFIVITYLHPQKGRRIHSGADSAIYRTMVVRTGLCLFASFLATALMFTMTAVGATAPTTPEHHVPQPADDKQCKKSIE